MKFKVAEVQEGGCDFLDMDLEELQQYLTRKHVPGLSPETWEVGDCSGFGGGYVFRIGRELP